MATPTPALTWSSLYNVAPGNNKKLTGDKILLPQSALEQLLAASTVTVITTSRSTNTHFDSFNPYSLAAARAEQSQWRDTQQQLPHPLTFRLVNTQTGNAVYAGIREFSADEGEVQLSPFLSDALGVAVHDHKPEASKRNGDEDVASPDALNIRKSEGTQIAVHAKQLPKGTYVRLRPLEAGYDPEDWKSLLERHMRENFTTLTIGQILSVEGLKKEDFRFLIDKVAPEGDGICVVDTDLEVDIEALNEEQARETVKRIMEKQTKAPGTTEGSSSGGSVDIWKPVTGQILGGDYVDYRLLAWDHTQALEIVLSSEDDNPMDLLISPYSSRQRARPREDEHVLGDFSSTMQKRIVIQPSNVMLEGADELFISIRSGNPPESEDLGHFSLRVKLISNESLQATLNKHASDTNDTEMHGPDEGECKNCNQWIPKRTMMLHENFCLRNNIVCPQCKNVFQKISQEWQDHWHCPHDSEFGNNSASKIRHDAVWHDPQQCPSCSHEAANLKELANHRTSVCPEKLILCQFCHLEVPQEGDPLNPSAESLLSGLTAHELADGARTTECHICSKIVRLRDMSTHLRHHELEKSSRVKPAICRNINCGRTLEGVGKNGELNAGSRMGHGLGNDIGLCGICFGPLYVSMHDPDGKAMRRRIERRYLSQLMQGCGKPWCSNSYCRTARAKAAQSTVSISAKDALSMVKPLLEHLADTRAAIYFCVDEASQTRRALADMLAAEGQYEPEWCVAGCEAGSGNLDESRQWLENWAPKRL